MAHCWIFEAQAMQKYVDLIDLAKSFATSIYFQKSASIQPRTSPDKFAVWLGLASPNLVSFLSLQKPRSPERKALRDMNRTPGRPAIFPNRTTISNVRCFPKSWKMCLGRCEAFKMLKTKTKRNTAHNSKLSLRCLFNARNHGDVTIITELWMYQMPDLLSSTVICNDARRKR